MHQAGDVVCGSGVPVVLDALHQRRRTVADAGYCHVDRSHVFLQVPDVAVTVRLAVRLWMRLEELRQSGLELPSPHVEPPIY